MPNWCSTNITINYYDEIKLEGFYNKLKEWTSCNYCENDFGLRWLGNVVGNSGIGIINEDGVSDLRCRGSIVDMYLGDGQIVISTETAWCPMLKMWVKLVDKYLPDAEIIYSAEELGCDIYNTNDIALQGSWVIDSWEDDLYETTTTEEVVAYLQDKYNTTETDIDILLKMLENDDECETYIHQWKYTNIEKWD